MDNIKIDGISDVELNKAYEIIGSGFDGIVANDFNIRKTEDKYGYIDVEFDFVKELSETYEDNKTRRLGYLMITKMKLSAEKYGDIVEMKDATSITFECQIKSGSKRGKSCTFTVSFKKSDTYYSCLYLPLVYRPFYTNAVLLLMPTTVGEECRMDKLIDNNELNGDSSECHGRLFYSISNGCSKRDGGKYYLNNVTLSYEGGDTNATGSMILKDPFRCYSETSTYNESTTNADELNYELQTNKIAMYGITEPFIALNNNPNNVIRDGVPVIKGEYSIDSHTTMLSSGGSDKWSLDELYYSKNIQILGEPTNNKLVTFNTNNPMDFFFHVKEWYPNEDEESNASEINIGYSGVQFYSDIKGVVDSKNNKVTYTCEGTTSNNVRYFVLRNDNGNEEVNTILDSICSIKVGNVSGASSPKVRCNGLNCNDYIHDGDSKYLNPRINGYGWKSIHTYLKRGVYNGEKKFNIFLSGKTIDTETNNGVEESTWWNYIDTTDKLHEAEANGGSITLTNEGRINRNYIIGVCDTYTSLSNEEYEEEKKHMFTHIKPHTNRFSIIKIYKIF